MWAVIGSEAFTTLKNTFQIFEPFSPARWSALWRILFLPWKQSVLPWKTAGQSQVAAGGNFLGAHTHQGDQWESRISKNIPACCFWWQARFFPPAAKIYAFSLLCTHYVFIFIPKVVWTITVLYFLNLFGIRSDYFIVSMQCLFKTLEWLTLVIVMLYFYIILIMHYPIKWNVCSLSCSFIF